MNKTKFTIIGEAKGKERPRACVVRGHAHIYTPSKTLEYESSVIRAYMDAMGWWDSSAVVPPKLEPVAVILDVKVGLSKADYNSKGEPNKKGRMKLSGEISPTKKPDLDNIAKSILDALNGYAFADDSQVVGLYVTKKYSLNPSVTVTIFSDLQRKETL